MMKTSPLWTFIYQDENIVVVNKASGLSVTGDRWTESKERLDRLLAGSLGLPVIFVVHRIDNGSSGLVIFAKNAAAHKRLSRAFENRTVEKKYIAIVHGMPVWKEEVCELPLLADANKRHQTIVERHRGKKSKTRFIFLFSTGNYSVIEAVPETGRQHQIRVHLASLGHSIVCDELYGSPQPVFLSSFKRMWQGDRIEERPLLSRLGLHAERLVIPDYPLTADAPLPKDMKALINQIKKCRAKAF
jgi:23S rRNA pseudouridine1911/1915/1917 synthase